jgi:catechol 2,3-dioxygenase-like lactoylglutathione lyase family enzyme
VKCFFSFLLAGAGIALGQNQTPSLAAPGFHHVHLNSVAPDAAIDFYTRQFPSSMRATFAGQPALKAGNVWVLFNKVGKPPATEPQTAFWHFGWNVVDSHKNLELYRQRPDVHLKPLYTGDGDATVDISSDTFPGGPGNPGQSRAQIAALKAQGDQPTRMGGFAFLNGPDGVIVEYAGNFPAERFSHVHLFESDPVCAQLWYQKHLNATPREGGKLSPEITEANCKAPAAAPTWVALVPQGFSRLPAGGVLFDDISMNWYVSEGNRPLTPSRGHEIDHVGLSVDHLDAWIAKLKQEGVKFLGKPYKLGDSRAVMIEGPSHESLELIEVR